MWRPLACLQRYPTRPPNAAAASSLFLKYNASIAILIIPTIKIVLFNSMCFFTSFFLCGIGKKYDEYEYIKKNYFFKKR